MQDATVEGILERCNDLNTYPEETLSPYREFEANGQTYYFTPGGFLYRRDLEIEHLGGVFCGYLSDEVWRYRTAA